MIAPQFAMPSGAFAPDVAFSRIPGRTVVPVDATAETSILTGSLSQMGVASVLHIACPDTQLPTRFGADVDAVLINPRGTRTPFPELVARWRQCAPTAAVIVLAPELRQDLVAESLRLGVDDVLPVPCNAHALFTRMEVACWRARTKSETPTHLRVVEGGPSSPESAAPDSLRLNLQTRVLSSATNAVVLGRRECSFAEVLCRRARQTVSRTELLRAVWKRDYLKVASSNPVDVYARHLRRRLQDLGCESALATVRYVGYRLDADATVD
jgi:DNA-binding response OmpR family regulator